MMLAPCTLCGKPTRMRDSEVPPAIDGVRHIACHEALGLHAHRAEPAEEQEHG